MPTDGGTLPDWPTLRRLDRERRRAELLQRAGRALEASDRAQVRAIEAMRRGELAACRQSLAERDTLATRAAVALAEFRKLERPAAQ